jgi:regulator of nucleoside diphosphate kinase
MRHVVNNFSIADVTLPASDYRRLVQLAGLGASEGCVDARFLLNEIKRAEIVPDRSARLDRIVTMGSWVTFWINWDLSRQTRQLVYPEDYASEQTQIPVMSPLGAALVGLRVGSEIPYFTAGRTNVVRIESVRRADPNAAVRVPFSNPMFQGEQLLDDDNSQPSAAFGKERR